MRGRLVAATAAVAAMAGLWALAPREADAFCGFYVSGADKQLVNDATQVVLMREGTRTVLAMQNAYQGPPENFALVIPVPVVLQKENVKTLPRELFAHVDQLGSPRLVEYWEQDPCAPGRGEEGHMGAGGPMKAMAAPAPQSRADLGVKIEAQFTVGEYEIVILSAKDSAGLATWLGENKYAIPPGSEPYLRPYVQSGSKFFVAKVDAKKVQFDDKGHTVLSPLRFHYDTDTFSLPIRLGLINAKDSQDLIVNILAKNQRYDVANYENVTIPTNLDVADDVRDKFGAMYAALFDRTLEQHPGSVVTEYAWDSGTCDPCPGPTLSQSELMTLGMDVLPSTQQQQQQQQHQGPPPTTGGARPMRPMPPPWWSPSMTLTRLHVRYGKDKRVDDLVFAAAPPIAGGREFLTSGGQIEKGAQPSSMNNFQARYVIRHRWTGDVKCENPRRGVWGGPPGGVQPPTKPATNLAYAPRGGVQLASLVREDVPEISLKSSVPEPAVGGGTPGAPGEGAPPSKSTCLGCRVGAPADGAAAALGGLALMGAIVRRRRRR